MKNLKNILKDIVTDKKSRNNLTTLNEVSDLFEICKKHGYTKDFDQFKSEFEILSKESGLSELSSDELFNVAGGINFNFKRLPSIALAALTLGGAVSPSGFAKENSVSSVSTTKKSTKEKLNILKDSIVKKGKKAVEKVVDVVKENPIESAAAATGVVAISTAAAIALKHLISEKNDVVNKVRKANYYDKESFKKDLLSMINVQTIGTSSIKLAISHELDFKDKYNTALRAINGSKILKGLSEGLKFMSSEKANELYNKGKLNNDEKKEFGNLFYCWQTLLVRARKLAILEKDADILPLIANEMLRIENNYKKFDIVKDGKLPTKAQKLIDISEKELELYKKLENIGKNTPENILNIASIAATGNIEEISKININEFTGEEDLKLEIPIQQQEQQAQQAQKPKLLDNTLATLLANRLSNKICMALKNQDYKNDRLDKYWHGFKGKENWVLVENIPNINYDEISGKYTVKTLEGLRVLDEITDETMYNRVKEISTLLCDLYGKLYNSVVSMEGKNKRYWKTCTWIGTESGVFSKNSNCHRIYTNTNEIGNNKKPIINITAVITLAQKYSLDQFKEEIKRYIKALSRY